MVFVGLHDFQLKVSKIHQVFAKNQHDKHRIWSVSFLLTFSFFLQNTVKPGYSKNRMLKDVDKVKSTIKISIEYLILCKNINNETTARNSTMLSHNVTTRCQTGRPSNPYKPYVNEDTLRGQNLLLKCCWPLEFLTQLIKV